MVGSYPQIPRVSRTQAAPQSLGPLALDSLGFFWIDFSIPLHPLVCHHFSNKTHKPKQYPHQQVSQVVGKSESSQWTPNKNQPWLLDGEITQSPHFCTGKLTRPRGPDLFVETGEADTSHQGVSFQSISQEFKISSEKAWPRRDAVEPSPPFWSCKKCQRLTRFQDLQMYSRFP